MPKKRVRVVTARDQNSESQPQTRVIATDTNPKVSRYTDNEIKARRRFATSSTMGGFSYRGASTDVINSGTAQFYSPQLSTDFLEKPQNLRERRAFTVSFIIRMK